MTSIVKNESTEAMMIDGDDDPLLPGYYRQYEFLHGYDDHPLSELEKTENSPLNKIFLEEINKEINKEIIELINKKARNESI